MYSKEVELQHSGVKGMKWGVRKVRSFTAKRINNVADRGDKKMARFQGGGKAVKAVSRAYAQAHIASLLSHVGSQYLYEKGISPGAAKAVNNVIQNAAKIHIYQTVAEVGAAKYRSRKRG